MATTRRTKISRRRNLQEEAIQEILVRLPVKALMRCKCVCKGWYAMIESKSFVHRHYEHEDNKEQLLVRHYKTVDGVYKYALFGDDECSGYEEPGLLQMPNLVENLIGPVNGVFCLVSVTNKLAFLNPALRQFAPLPECDTERPRNMFSLDDVIGFGVDERSGEFKVVTIKYYWQKARGHIHYPPFINIYRSSTNTWTEYEEDKSMFKSEYSAYGSVCKTFLNGVYYWVMEYGDSNVAAVLSFKMSTEKFKEIRVPECVQSNIGHLTLYNGSLALISYDFGKAKKCDIWVRGNRGRWTRHAVLGPFEGVCWPLSFWKNDEFLMETGGSFLALYNVTTGESRVLNVRVKAKHSFVKWIFRYKESLVSLKDVGGNCVYWDANSDFIRFLLEE